MQIIHEIQFSAKEKHITSPLEKPIFKAVEEKKIAVYFENHATP
jgi:hypothetical protein